MASDYTDGLALEAIKLVFAYLPRAVKDGKNDLQAREKMHNAATIAGMAFANAFLGLVHSLAHKIGGEYHLVHGRTCAILLPHVIRYNGSVPTKLAVWPKYEEYQCDKRYLDICRVVGLKAATPAEATEALANAVMPIPIFPSPSIITITPNRFCFRKGKRCRSIGCKRRLKERKSPVAPSISKTLIP